MNMPIPAMIGLFLILTVVVLLIWTRIVRPRTKAGDGSYRESIPGEGSAGGGGD